MSLYQCLKKRQGRARILTSAIITLTDEYRAKKERKIILDLVKTDITHHSNEFLRDERRFERFPVEVPVRVKLLPGKGKERPIFTQTLDLSATGAFFPELVGINRGNMVKIDLYMVFEDPDETDAVHDVVVMTITGKVVRSDATGTAVCFDEDYQMSTRKLLPTKGNRLSVVRKNGKTTRYQALFKKLWKEENTHLPGTPPGDNNDEDGISVDAPDK